MTGLNRVTSREVMWRPVMDDLSFEQARFSRSTSGSEISGSVMIAEGGAPIRVDYRIACDGEWRTRTVEVEQTWRGARCMLRVDHDGQGQWYSGNLQSLRPIPQMREVSRRASPRHNRKRRTLG